MTRRRAFFLSSGVASSLFLLLLLLAACGDGGSDPFGVESEIVAEANFPVALAFTPDGRLFYNEQYTGNIRVVTADGELLTEPFATVPVFASFDWGLIGIAVDPDFEANHYLYVSYMEVVEDEGDTRIARPIVLRYTDEDSLGVDSEVIVGDLQETPVEHQFFNAIGDIAFGPDGFLYTAIGDFDDRDLAQDLAATPGKILRFDKEDGSAPADNPFVDEEDADPLVFAYGFRRPSHLAFDPQTGELYSSDAGPVTCDELNIVEAGANYGWPMNFDFRYEDCEAGQVTAPIYFYAQDEMRPVDHLSVVRPRGIAFASASEYPLLGDSLIVCEEDTSAMRRLVFGGASKEVLADDVVVQDCQLDVAISPDGIIYYSNLTEIRRLMPIPQEDEG